MKRNESIEKDALTEMMNPSVSPSAARDAEIREGIEMVLQDFSPKGNIPDSATVDEVEESQPIPTVASPTIQRRVSSKQRRLSLEEYRNTYLKVPVIKDRKPVFLS